MTSFYHLIINKYCLNNIANYIDEFQELRARNDLNETKPREVHKFITELRELIRSQIEVRNVDSIPKAITLATWYESQLFKFPKLFTKKPFTKFNLDKPIFSNTTCSPSNTHPQKNVVEQTANPKACLNHLFLIKKPNRILNLAYLNALV